MAQRHDRAGYSTLMLRENGKRSFVRVHRLVAKAFIPNVNDYPEINHIDENKDNNSVENLEWCTNDYNESYGTRAKRSAKNHEKSVIRTSKDGDVVAFDSIKEAAKHTNCGTATIHRCLKSGRISNQIGFGFSYA